MSRWPDQMREVPDRVIIETELAEVGANYGIARQRGRQQPGEDKDVRITSRQIVEGGEKDLRSRSAIQRAVPLRQGRLARPSYRICPGR